MKHLRHPIRAIREPFGTAGLIVAVVALVVALGGAAFAATGGLTGKQKKEVTKIAKKFAGKPGAAGAQGPEGKQGPAGASGAEGKQGQAGKDGTNGTNGESVTINTYTGPECANASGEGGAEFINGTGTAYACNGEAAAGGGGNYPETLPSGKSETGTWSFTDNFGEATTRWIPISFPIPLAEPLENNTPECGTVGHLPCIAVHFIPELSNSDTPPAGCHGGNSAGPEGEVSADPGNLCVFTSFAGFGPFNESGIHGVEPWHETAAGRQGAVLEVEGSENETEFAKGVWVLTAP